MAAAEASPFPHVETEAEEGYIDQPDEFDLAEEFGASMPIREEDIEPDDTGELPDLEAVERKIPDRTKLLLEELLRVRLTKVQRVNPKKIR